jgi:hypothetical protein
MPHTTTKSEFLQGGAGSDCSSGSGGGLVGRVPGLGGRVRDPEPGGLGKCTTTLGHGLSPHDS